MSDGFIDHLPSHERRKWLDIKEHSPAEYERLREKYQEGMRERESIAEKMSDFADFALALETDKGLKESITKSVSEHISEKGADKIVEGKLDKKTKTALEAGHFDVVTDTTREGSPKLSVKPKSAGEGGSIDAPSGNVAEALPLKPAFQDRLLASFQIKAKKSV